MSKVPAPSAIAELLKPFTWFPPMWAFGCGVVASGVSVAERWPLVLAGLVLAGPAVCATSQAVNDWFDREVDAINEPRRPIPSGRMPGRWGLYIAIGWTLLSLVLAATLGPVGFGAGLLGLALAWAYSAPPLRLKRNGWWGNAACATRDRNALTVLVGEPDQARAVHRVARPASHENSAAQKHEPKRSTTIQSVLQRTASRCGPPVEQVSGRGENGEAPPQRQ